MDAHLSETQYNQLENLRQYVLWEDNDACFIERDCILLSIQDEINQTDAEYKTALMTARVLERLSTPVHAYDVLLGRMVQGRFWGGPRLLLSMGNPITQDSLYSMGHMHLDYPTLLEKGFDTLAEEAEQTARRLGTPESRCFYDNTRLVCNAIKGFAQRYTRQARLAAGSLLKGYDHTAVLRAADALERVPHGPAFDFFSALQSIIFTHMLYSCVIGARDFGLGWMERYLYPYYQKDIDNSKLTRDEAVWLTANFLLKLNEISGTRSDQDPHKPVWSQASNQYLLLGGKLDAGTGGGNEMGLIILEAARLSRFPQPSLMVYLSTFTPPDYVRAVMRNAVELSGQVQFYNSDVICENLLRQDIAPDIVYDAAHHACCLFIIPYRMGPRHTHVREMSAPKIVMMMLNSGADLSGSYEPVDDVPPAEDIRSFDEAEALVHQILRALMKRAEQESIERWNQFGYGEPWLPKYNFDSVLLRGCVTQGKDWTRGGIDLLVHTHNITGVSTAVDSMMTLKRLVFDEPVLSLGALRDFCAANFEGQEPLRQRILWEVPKFGNNLPEPDGLCERLMNVFHETSQSFKTLWPKGVIHVESIYHLWAHNTNYEQFTATPDGRLFGTPINENQSPVYGADTHGLTSLLLSLAHLKTNYLMQGGLNIKFGGTIPPQTLHAAVDTYFSSGGLHLGVNFVSRETLEDARAHPEQYRSLQIRMYGYSALYTLLPEHQQLELIRRTEY